MKLKKMPIEELELMSYTDMTYMILEENKKPMNTADIFKEICKLLDFSDEEYSLKIGDYYTSLTLDKRFILLDTNEWDLRNHHSIEIDMDDEDDDTESEEEEEEVEEFTEEEEDEENIDEVIDDDLDSDIDDLTIVTEDELEEDN